MRRPASGSAIDRSMATDDRWPTAASKDYTDPHRDRSGLQSPHKRVRNWPCRSRPHYPVGSRDTADLRALPAQAAQRTPRHTHRAMRSFLAHARKNLRGSVVFAGAATTTYVRGSPLTRAATVVDLPEARMSDWRGRGGSTRRLHYRALCASNDPRTEAQRSASTAKATKRRSRSAFRVRHVPSGNTSRYASGAASKGSAAGAVRRSRATPEASVVCCQPRRRGP